MKVSSRSLSLVYYGWSSFDRFLEADGEGAVFIVMAFLGQLTHASRFQRRWILQEAHLSTSAILYWGDVWIPWRYVGLAAAVLRTQYDSLVRQTAFAAGIYHAYLIFRLSKQMALPPLALSFIHLLRLTRGFGSADSHYIIFALLGITTKDNEGDRRFVDVDYALSQPDLLRKVAERLLLQENMPLDFLTDAGLERQVQKPTWIPNWTVDEIASMAPSTLNDSFMPSRGLAFNRWPTNDPKVLAVDGIAVSIVLWTSQQFSGGWSGNLRSLYELVVPFIRFLRNYCNSSREPCLLEETRTERRKAIPVLTRHFAAFLSTFQPHPFRPTSFLPDTYDIITKASLEGDLPGEPQRFLDVADVLCSKRRLFVTASGHLGYGPGNAEVGDIVAILGGASMPFILQREDDAYSIVGECFIDETMHGEAVQVVKEKQRLRGPITAKGFRKAMFLNASLDSGEKLAEEAFNTIVKRLDEGCSKLEIQRFDIC